MSKKLLATLASAVLVASIGTAALPVNADYVDEDNVTHYGWTLACEEVNESAFEFGEDGMITDIYAASAVDTENQFTNMFALRDVSYAADEEYTVQATFTPDPESDLSAERAYGIVAWYADENNYLIYWLQQKMDGGWSGQFYGRVGGVYKTAISTKTGKTTWQSFEFDDMWWDNGNVSHPDLVGTRNVVIEKTLSIKVVSKIETVTVEGTDYTCRSFELYEVYNNTEFLSNKYYMRDITSESPAFNVGLYAQKFDVSVSGYSCVASGDEARISAVETAMTGLSATVDAQEDIDAIVKARADYERLLDLQARMTDEAAATAALEAAENGVGTYVDGLIVALDSSSATFKEDVDEVYNLYMSLTDLLAAKVTKTAELQAALEEAQNPTPPEDSSDSSVPSDSSDSVEQPDSTASATTSDSVGGGTSSDGGSGCGSILPIGGVCAAALLLGGIAVLPRKRK